MAGAALRRPPFVILCGRRSTSDVLCCVFFASPIVGLRGVVTTRKFHGRRGILSHAIKIGESLARNIDFEVANLEVREENHKKTS